MTQNNTFNPIKEDKTGVTSKKMVWTTKTLDTAVKGLTQGRRLVANPFYENNIKLLKGDLVYKRTKEEIDEWKRCKDDILYFAEKYCQLMTPEGIKNITLRDYQRDYLKHLTEHQLSIFLSARQSGKTVTTAIFSLHYICFQTDKQVLICGNKRRTAIEIMDKIKAIYYELPHFLKPGIYKWNESDIVLDNGCRIIAEATTINSGIGFTIHCLICDEFAHIPPNILDSFFNNIFPTVTAGKAKMIITSTQNGYNLFYRLWVSAKAGLSDWSPFEVTWDMVPEWNPDKKCWEKRDEEWHRRQVANYGGEEAFNKQFGTNFDISANTLINNKYLKKVHSQAVLFENKFIPGVEYSEYYFWKPDYEPSSDLRNSHIVITVDISEGLDQDYTTCCFSRIIDNSGTMECIGIFHNNNLSIDQWSKSLQELICYHMSMDNVLLSFERNLFGDLFLAQLRTNTDKYDIIRDRFDPGILFKYYNEQNTKYTYGIKITPGNKTKYCVLFKSEYEKGKIINNSTLFLNELDNFCDNKGNNTYAASLGHDDVVMAQIQLSIIKQSYQFKMLLDDYALGNSTVDENIYNPYDTAWVMSITADDPHLPWNRLK